MSSLGQIIQTLKTLSLSSKNRYYIGKNICLFTVCFVSLNKLYFKLLQKLYLFELIVFSYVSDFNEISKSSIAMKKIGVDAEHAGTLSFNFH